MSTPFTRGGRPLAAGFLAVALLVSAFSAVFVPSGVALAADGVAVGDALILDGPGGQYGILTVAPAGTYISVDGDPVDGYYPVSFDGISGWTATGMIEVSGGGGGNGGGGGGNGGGGGGNGHNGKTREMGNGGVETVSADPVYADSGVPAEAAPVTGGSYGPGGSGYSEDQIVSIIGEAAANYGQSPDAMLRVARCESGLDPYAVGGGGTYYGLFQFVPDTFANTPYGQYEITDAWANANAAAWMWSEGRKGDWVCQ
ncbi:MAG: transglycosylase SLT domain-containing protein [Thermomicrobiales bacterium]